MSSPPARSPFSRAFVPDGPARGLSVVALVLVVLFATSLAGTLFPLELLNPAWQLRLSNGLIQNSPLALLGLVLLRLARVIDTQSARIQARWQAWSQLAVIAALGFVLLLPLQISAGLRVYGQVQGTQDMRIVNAQKRLVQLRKAVSAAGDTADLSRRLKQLQGPVLGPADLSQPLPLLKQQLQVVLNQAEQQINRERSRLPPANPWRLVPDLLRNTIAAVALAIGFAAMARRPGVELSLLQELERSFLLRPRKAP